MSYLDERRARHRTTWQAEFSLAYVHAIASAAGVRCLVDNVDIDGIDVQLGAKGSRGVCKYPKLEVQIKSWTKPVEQQECLQYRLKVHNYNELRWTTEEAGLPRILVLVVMPPFQSAWFSMTDEQGTLRHCAYWRSLIGEPPTDYEDKVPIAVPKSNQFSVQALEEIMERVANKRDP